MTVVDTKRITIGFLESQREQVVSTLKKLGTVHIDDMFSLVSSEDKEAPSPDEPESPQLQKETGPGTGEFRTMLMESSSEEQEDKIELLMKATQSISPYREKDSFVVDLVGGIIFGTLNIHPLVSRDDYEATVKEREKLLQKAGEIKELVSRTRELESRIKGLEDKARNFRRFGNFDVPLGLLENTESTRIRTGTMSKDAKKDLLQGPWEEGVLPPVLLTVKESKKKLELIVVYLRTDTAEVELALDRVGFKEIPLPEGKESPATEAKALELQVRKLEREMEAVKEELASYADLYLQFLSLVDYYSNRKSELDAGEHFLGTDQTVFITGWVEERKVQRTMDALREVSSSVDFHVREPQEDEKVPTRIRSAPWANPFSFITRMYGSPQYGDIDPTPFLVPFFVVFLGVCLSDAGYGLLLLGLSLYGLKTLHKGKNFLRVLAVGSLATVIVGIFLGSWFGADLEADISGMPGFVIAARDLMKSLQFINLFEGSGVINFFILSLVLGLIQVFTGLGVKMYWNIKHGKLKEALLDEGCWVIFLAGFLGFMIDFLAGLPAALSTLFQVVTAVGSLLLIGTQGRHQKGVVKKLFTGVLSLYGLTGYFSDVLSYSRLLALGLATGLIALIVNLLGYILYSGFAGLHPVIGSILGLIILIPFLAIAHLANIALSLLSAFIHSLRLQYIEYFNKFYPGGGRTFSPFREEFRKVDIVSSNS